MSNIITELATKAGISPELARKGMGMTLEFLKGQLPADAYSQLSAAVPGAEGMVAAANQAEGQPAGGVFGSVAGMLGKLVGGGGAELAGKLANAGFSMEQVQSFLPQVLAFLKDKLPPDVLQKLSGLIPAATGSPR